MSDLSTIARTVLGVTGTFLLLLAVLILYETPPATGYEISIYQAYPWYFWAAIVGSIVSGQLVVLQSSISGAIDERDWVFGGGLIVVPGLTLMMLPYLRGYPIYGRADVLTHVGIARGLAESGISQTIYSPMHILIQSLSGATGLDQMFLFNLLPVVFSVVFFGSMYFLIHHLFESRRMALFALPFVVLPFLGHTHILPTPWALSLLLIPFVLFLFVKEHRTHAFPVRAMLLVAIVGIIIYHPLMAIFVAIAFGLYAIIQRTPPFVSRQVVPKNAAFIPFALAVVIFGAWYTNFPGIIIRFLNVFTNLIMGSEETQLEAQTETIARTSPNLVDIFGLAAFRYGIDVILFGLATIFFAYIIFRWWQTGEHPDVFTMLFGGCVLLFASIAIVFLTNDFIAGWGRPLSVVSVFAAVLAWQAWSVALRQTNSPASQVTLAVVLVLLMTVVVYLSVFGLFFSPNTGGYNHQVTEMELDGMEWTFENRNEDLLMEEIGIRQYRFYHLQHDTNREPGTVRRAETMPPDHFNYTEYETLGQSYADNRYLILTKRGEIYYPEVHPDYPEHWRFTAENFEQLEGDASTARVYDNDELTLYRVDSNSAET